MAIGFLRAAKTKFVSADASPRHPVGGGDLDLGVRCKTRADRNDGRGVGVERYLADGKMWGARVSGASDERTDIHRRRR